MMRPTEITTALFTNMCLRPPYETWGSNNSRWPPMLSFLDPGETDVKDYRDPGKEPYIS